MKAVNKKNITFGWIFKILVLEDFLELEIHIEIGIMPRRVLLISGVSTNLGNIIGVDRTGGHRDNRPTGWRASTVRTWHMIIHCRACQLNDLRPSATEKDFRVPERIIYTAFGASAI